jgi:hypothetical protein
MDMQREGRIWVLSESVGVRRTEYGKVVFKWLISKGMVMG